MTDMAGSAAATVYRTRIVGRAIHARLVDIDLDGWHPEKVTITMRRPWLAQHIGPWRIGKVSVQGPAWHGKAREWRTEAYDRKTLPAWLVPVVAELMVLWEQR